MGANNRMPSRLSSGKPTLKDKLGEGTFAEVWSVAIGSEVVAAKMYKVVVGDAKMSKAQQERRYKKEKEAYIQLGPHPNIPTVWLDGPLLPGCSNMFWMEHMDGGDLESVSKVIDKWYLFAAAVSRRSWSGCFL